MGRGKGRREMLREGSREEGRGREVKEKGTGRGPAIFEILENALRTAMSDITVQQRRHER